MSVILSACRRHSKQKVLARALKKKAEKQRVRRLLKLKKEEELQELENYANEAFSKMWQFIVDDEEYTIVLHLASDKDTVDIYCNYDEMTDVMTNCCQGEATFDFVFGAAYKARITCTQGKHGEGLVHTLTVNGYAVPEAE
ncbi:uncharacterized protein LOC132738063 isoform X1 [Ruditapes philippinarum]|uniref:uncharacterized protein LOC132738063 isoform X1 n=1 Tax=Ruditapes philippinarum TaxID=129788 RepID=UPI00295AFF8C|nr:uncharacterized protein LOC132738063 isoform X1 [Ruditapes philippinarum]